ncbi:MAG TPA: ABC transporter permease [Gemmatales bacterium]|nr:ABC transporter permease [Gemmatales bacterium]
MSWRRLLWASLTYHGRANLSVVLGVALATSVLVGALLVGESLQASLRHQAIDRLGQIDLALVGDRFFPENLADRLAAATTAAESRIAPVIMLRGSAVHRLDGGGVRRAGRVQVVAVDERYWPLHGLPERSLRGEVIVNAVLAADLEADVGQFVEVRLEQPHAIPADSFVGRRTATEGVLLPAARVAEVLPMSGPGRFSLAAEQAEPRIVYVALSTLQRLLRDEGLQPQGVVNGLLIAAPKLADDEGWWRQRVNELAQLEDMGFDLQPDASGSRYLSFTSRRMLIEPAAAAAVTEAARTHGWQAQPTLTYLANVTYHRTGLVASVAASVARLAHGALPFDLIWLGEAANSFTPYATICGLDPTLPAPWGPFLDATGQPAPALADDEILLTDTMAADLWPLGGWERERGAAVAELRYFVEGPDRALREETTPFKLAGVVPLQGPAADRSLTPEFPGLAGQSIRDWRPPFPKSQWHPDWVRDKDERFYRQWRVAPRAFVSLATARKLWQSRHGDLTSIRLAAPPTDLKSLEQTVRAALKPLLVAEHQGLAPTAIRAQLLGWLFVGFSFFLILAAGLLVGLFVRLRLEQRQRELGLYFALGIPARRVQALLVREGLILSLAGALGGTLLAVGYAWLLIQAIGWGWTGSLPSSFLQFHVLTWATPLGRLPGPGVFIGFGLSLLIAWATIRLALRGWQALAPQSLLVAAAMNLPVDARRSLRRTAALALATGGAGLALAMAGRLVPPSQAPGLFFGAGFLILVSGLTALRWWLIWRSDCARVPLLGLMRFAAAQTARRPSRSLLTAGLIASGVFIVLAVEAFRKSPTDVEDRTGGTGGFTWVGEADVPLPWSPDDAASWQRLATDAMNGSDDVPPWPSEMQLFGLHLRPGDDVSCLNLYAPRQPRLLGVPDALIERGGFSFMLPGDATPAETENPWRLLLRPATEAVPILADDHAAQWVLQKNIGDVWELADESGQPFKVRLVGLLNSSMLQSELLMAGRHFRQHFPSRAGFGFFLIDAPTAASAAARHSLDELLGDAFGWTVTSAAERLANFQAVENTYLSTFQVLGGIGLLLGSLGLAIVLLRNFTERIGEWALLQALGFSRRTLGGLALVEQGVMLLAGLVVGVVAAAVAVAPMWMEMGRQIPWRPLALMLVLLPVVGMLAGLAALRSVLRVPLLQALRRE